MGFWESFGIGIGGALVAEYLPIHSLRYTPSEEWPPWVTSFRFWLLTVIGCLVGGGIAGGYSSATKMTWYLALNVGAAWPSVINGLARATPSLKARDADVD